MSEENNRDVKTYLNLDGETDNDSIPQQMENSSTNETYQPALTRDDLQNLASGQNNVILIGKIMFLIHIKLLHLGMIGWEK